MASHRLRSLGYRTHIKQNHEYTYQVYITYKDFSCLDWPITYTGIHVKQMLHEITLYIIVSNYYITQWQSKNC